MIKIIICFLLVGYVSSLTFDKNVDLENSNITKIVINNDILYIYDKLTIKILSIKNINCYSSICQNKFNQVICYKNTISNLWKCGDSNYKIKLDCTNDCKFYAYDLAHTIDYFKINNNSNIVNNILFYMYFLLLILTIFGYLLIQLFCFLRYLLIEILDCDLDDHYYDIYTRRKPNKQ